MLLLIALLLPLTPDSDALVQFRRWSRSPVPDLRVQAIRTLRDVEGEPARAALVSMLDDDHPAVRDAAMAALAARPADEPLASSVARLRSPRARLAGLRALLERGEDVTPFLDDADAGVRARALAFGRWDALRAARCRADRDARVRAWALVRLGDATWVAPAIRDRAEPVRVAVAQLTHEPAHVVTLLRDRAWRVRLAAVLACERLRHRDCVPALIGALKEKPGRVRARMVQALESLTGAPWGDDRKRWEKWWARAGARFTVRARRPVRKKGGSVAALSFRRIPVTSRRAVFVLDASRSMTEPLPHKPSVRRWDAVVDDLVAVLRRMPADSRFNVVLFRTGFEPWKNKLVAAGRGRVRACEKWIRAQSPAGWTNLFDALAWSLEDDAVDAVYVLTDGVPSRGAFTKRKAILRELAYLNRFRMVQINCVQAGSSEGLGKRWNGFLEDLAQAHDGVAVRE